MFDLLVVLDEKSREGAVHLLDVEIFHRISQMVVLDYKSEDQEGQ